MDHGKDASKNNQTCLPRCHTFEYDLIVDRVTDHPDQDVYIYFGSRNVEVSEKIEVLL